MGAELRTGCIPKVFRKGLGDYLWDDMSVEGILYEVFGSKHATFPLL